MNLVSEPVTFEFKVKGEVSREKQEQMRKEMEESNGEYDNIFFKIFRRLPERIRNATVTGTIIDQIGSGNIRYFEFITFKKISDDVTLVSIGVSAIFMSLYESQQKITTMFGSKNAHEDVRRILKKKAIKEYDLELVVDAR